MYLLDMISSSYPVGLISRVLSRHLDRIQTLCFLDNEFGQSPEACETIRRHILVPSNLLLRRGGKKVSILAVGVCDKENHRVLVRYHVHGSDGTSYFVASLFPESARQKAARKEREEARKSGQLSVGSPNRGKGRAKVEKKKRRKAVAV
jgi:hypothetical protein